MGEFRPEGDSLWVKISLSQELLPYVVPKGYIAMDGTSLTVCEVNHTEKWFNVMLISHTQQCIVVPKKNIGERVNLEADCLGKYAAAAVTGVATRVSALEKQLTFTQAVAAVSFGLAALCAARLF